MWQLDSLNIRLDGIQARPVAAMLLAGSLMGFVLGQEAGHGHSLRQPHVVARPPVGAVARHMPVKPSPTKGSTTTHIVNPVVSYSPPAAQTSKDGDHHGDGGDGGDGGGHGGGQGGHHHGNGQGGQGGQGGHGHGQHGGHGHGGAQTKYE